MDGQDRQPIVEAAAFALLRQYGNTAWFEAGAWADACLHAGDLDGERYWLAVVEQIKEIEQIN